MVLSLQHRSPASSLWLAGVVSFGEGSAAFGDSASAHRAEGIARRGSMGRSDQRRPSVTPSFYRAARKPCPMLLGSLENGLDSTGLDCTGVDAA
ncbi:MAG: hypothetical protein J0L92_02230 [Deltaproteobacteria bacterium]|nr:hypothetical protein [Deltaproteobacteria bacterium]